MADTTPLRDQIAHASHELKLARRDGSADWIEKAATALDVRSLTSFPGSPQECNDYEDH